MSNVISIITECLDLYSIALCHNKIGVFKSVTLRNVSDFNLKNLELEISSYPEFFTDYTARIGEIASGRYVRLSEIDLSVDTTRLSYLSSPTASSIKISIKSQGEILAEKTEQVQLLPYDNVPSLNTYPELASAFVTPAQPEVRMIGDSVYKYIEGSGISVNMDMWKGLDREASYSIVKAIYEAIRDLRITYNSSSVTVESKHTKIKLSETLISYKNGNTLEISLLFASVCEYLGFNPFLVFDSGKSYVGVFFTNKTFESPIVDDSRPFALLKDGMSYDFCILDTASLVNGTHISFEDSAKSASHSVNDSDFPVIIDVKECRNVGISPIHNRIRKDGNVIFEEVSLNKDTKKFTLPGSFSTLATNVKNALSKNDASSSLICAPDKRVAFLVGGGKNISAKFMFNSRVQLKSFSIPGVVGCDFKDMIPTLVKLNSNADITDVSDVVSTLYDKDELSKRLIKLIDSERSKRSLYLAFGLVTGTVNETEIAAPLFLIPANLVCTNQSFYLSVSKNATVLNRAVLDFLHEKIGFTIPFDINRFDFIEDYERITSKLHDEALRFDGLDFLDLVFLIKTPFEDYLTSCISQTEYFESSEVISNLVLKTPFDRAEGMQVTADEMQPNFYDMPLLLDSSQANAFNTAMVNTASIVSGPNGSGKTRVAASLAFAALNKGETVLYASASDSNIYKFKKYAKECKMSDSIFSISKNNLQKNTFSYGASADFENDAIAVKNKIESSHKYVSNYFYALHRDREIGFSLYEAVSQYERYKTFPYAVNFTNSEVSHLSREDVVHWFDVVSNLAKAGADCHEPFNNPLMYVKCKDFSYDLKSNASLLLAEYQSALAEFVNLQNRISEFLGLEVSVIKEEQTDSLLKLIELIRDNVGYIFPNAYQKKDSESDFIKIESFLETSSDFFESKEFLKSQFSEDVLSLDTDSLLNDWRSASLRFAIAKVSAQNSIKNKLKVFAHDPRIVTNDTIADLFSKISSYKSSLARMSEMSSFVRQIFGIDILSEVSKGNKEIFDYIRKSIDLTKEYYSLVYDIYNSEKKPESVFSHNVSLFANESRLLRELNEMYGEFVSAKLKINELEDKLTSLIALDFVKAKRDNSKIWYYFVEKFVDRMIDNIDLLKHWCAWNREKEKAESVGLAGVVSLYTTEQMTYNDIRNAFLKGFFKTVSEYILSCEPDINNFSKDNFENVCDELLEYADKWRYELSESFRKNQLLSVKASVEKDLGLSFEAAINSAKKDFEFSDKFYNVSSESKKILKTLKPCVISKGCALLSQLGAEKFDLLLVDTVEDYRIEEILLLIPLAKRVVFFSESKSGNSLVEYMKELSVPEMGLSWIYSYNYSTRLVSKLFYPDSSSFVFPDNEKIGIRVVKQKATYDRRNTRTNFIEASAVVDEIMKKIETDSSASFSVIAMTEEQSELIELLFTKRLQSLGENERKKFFDRTEPFYISSINKASFNPCDTVIFSTTFSVEERPKYNDTISRTIPEFSSEKAKHNLVNTLLCARNEFVLVTSLDNDMLDKFKTVIPSYSMFKEIVTNLYASSNYLDSEMNKAPRIENSVMRQVINHIESLGYRADIDVGTNSCRIDVAVKNKSGNGYLFGIVFDESAYMYGGDLISRTLIYKTLEKKLGWKIFRIYTVEWFENSPKQLDMISDMLKEDDEKKNVISFDSLSS